MSKFEVKVEIASDIETVMKAFWELEDWPSVAKHVRAINMIYADENVQVLNMHVETRNHHDIFKSVRYRDDNNIYFFQPAPPPILNRHWGSWKFTAAGAWVTVTSFHDMDVDLTGSAAFLSQTGIDAVDSDEVLKKITELIENNSLQTMNALKNRLERENAKSHAA